MFAFIALLKRQFLLKFTRRAVILSITLLVSNIIFFLCAYFFVKESNVQFLFAFNVVVNFVLTIVIFNFGSTSLLDDTKNKNKNINIVPINSYLINFSYFFYSFIVNFCFKLLFSLILYVMIFIKFGIFIYQSIGFILFDAFLFSFHVSSLEMFFEFFARKFIKYVKIILIITFIFVPGIIKIIFPKVQPFLTDLLCEVHNETFIRMLGLEKIKNNNFLVVSIINLFILV